MNGELVAKESGFEMKPRNLDEAMKFCDIMANSDLVPKDYRNKPGNIMVAIQLGAELGMTPMRALRCIAVINGRASMWGDEMLAMVLSSPQCEYVDESESTDKEGVCKVKRKGHPELVSRFTLQDAQKAGLLQKGGTWQAYTARMLKLRARGFGLRDKFADSLAGLITAEEALDMPHEKHEAFIENVQLKPPSLKDKLKQQLEPVEPDGAGKSERDPVQQGSDAAPISSDDDSPVSEWLHKLRAASTQRDINHIYHSCPEELRQDIYTEYLKALKSSGKK